MTDNAFLDALAHDPLDDVTRAVYADWLEERGDERSAFLRAELACDEADVRRTLNQVDEEWAYLAGRRWDVVLRPGYATQHKIGVIRAMRLVRRFSLASAKRLSESTDPVMLPAVPAALALEGLDRQRVDHREWQARYNTGQITPLPEVFFRPAQSVAVPARSLPFQPSFEAQTFLRLHALRPGHILGTARAVADVGHYALFDALDLCLGQLPATFAQAHGTGDAHELASRFTNLADVRVYEARHGSERAQWMDLHLRPVTVEQFEALQAGYIRILGRSHPGWELDGIEEPFLRRLPKFFAEEVLARLAPLGPFAMRPSEDQP